MRLLTYQSQLVFNILNKGEIYRAKPSISFKKEYGALIEMLNLNCKCPIFTVVKGRKQNTSGRVSGSVRFEIEVPDELVKITEFSVWADFIYGVKFSKNSSYTKLLSTTDPSYTQKKHDDIIKELKTQKPFKEYQYPQVIIEEIRPEWIISTRKIKSSNQSIDVIEKFVNVFRQ